MAIRYVGKWKDSPNGDSPTLWVDDETNLCYMQGYSVVDPSVRAELLAASGRDSVPAGETLISFHRDMADLFVEVRRDDSGPQTD